MEEKFKNYIEDCLEELIERYRSSLQETDVNDFNKGVSLAYSEILSFMLNQAEVFEVKNEMKDKIKEFHAPL